MKKISNNLNKIQLKYQNSAFRIMRKIVLEIKIKQAQEVELEIKIKQAEEVQLEIKIKQAEEEENEEDEVIDLVEDS